MAKTRRNTRRRSTRRRRAGNYPTCSAMRKEKCPEGGKHHLILLGPAQSLYGCTKCRKRCVDSN